MKTVTLAVLAQMATAPKPATLGNSQAAVGPLAVVALVVSSADRAIRAKIAQRKGTSPRRVVVFLLSVFLANLGTSLLSRCEQNAGAVMQAA